jgi:hypothetical protein
VFEPSFSTAVASFQEGMIVSLLLLSGRDCPGRLHCERLMKHREWRRPFSKLELRGVTPAHLPRWRKSLGR